MKIILLDEKDLHLHSALFVTPTSMHGVLSMRIIFMVVLGRLGSFLLLFFNGLVQFSIMDTLYISILCALASPILTLLISSVAKNKVEGLTLLKVANVTLFLPIIACFVQSPWEYLLGIFPAFWVFHLIDPLIAKHWVFLIGILVVAALNYFSFRFALKRMGA